MNRMTRVATVAAAMFGFLVSTPSHAVFIGNADGGFDFPQGAVSFADAVVSYTPGSPLHPLTRDATKALGVPDYTTTTALACIQLISCPFVSLGTGGTLILQFVDNYLTGSNNSNPDLFIFETGPIVQGTFVAISSDGANWFNIGAVSGSLRAIDIDQFGFNSSNVFRFVRLIDNGTFDAGEEGESAEVLGADIDAVGAISTVLAVPIPPAVWLLFSGLAGLIAVGRRRSVAHA